MIVSRTGSGSADCGLQLVELTGFTIKHRELRQAVKIERPGYPVQPVLAAFIVLKLQVIGSESGIVCPDPAAFIRDAGYDFVTIDDGDEIAELYDVEYLRGLFVVDGDGMIAYRRKWTELSAGQEAADLGESQVRNTLDTLLTD